MREYRRAFWEIQALKGQQVGEKTTLVYIKNVWKPQNPINLITKSLFAATKITFKVFWTVWNIIFQHLCFTRGRFLVIFDLLFIGLN